MTCALRLHRFFSASSKAISKAHTRQASSQSAPYALDRSGNFARLTDAHISQFRAFLPPSSVLTSSSSSSLSQFNSDWLGKYNGSSSLVLRPTCTEQVGQILRFCSEERLAVVPQGGNTGLVGGSVPVFDEIVLSLSLLDRIIQTDAKAGWVKCQAGCVLQVVEEAIRPQGMRMPLDLGAKGSCTVGGNVATNAGGVRFLRYGSMHANVLGLEVVLSSGQILSMNMSGLRKDNTGPDLKHLFIGSEGILGVVTAVCIQTLPLGSSSSVAVLALKSYAHVLQAFQMAKAELGEVLSAFELWDGPSHKLSGRKVFSEEGADDLPFFVLVEYIGSNKAHDDEKMENLMTKLMEEDLIVDGLMAQSETDTRAFWELREGITEHAGKQGKVYKYDLSLPLDSMYSVVEKVRERFGAEQASGVSVIGFGHVGDGNVHIGVICRDGWNADVERKLEPWIFEVVSELGGSVSAEHGLGRQKRHAIGYGHGAQEIEVMRSLKRMVDPRGILNPYKVLAEPGQERWPVQSPPAES